MSKIHDIGGMHGFGPVLDDPGDIEHVWEAWEARVFGLVRALRHNGFHSSDEFRDAIESLPPAQYLDAGYYERWLAAVEALLVRKGALRDGELERRLAAREPQPAGSIPEERGAEGRDG